MPNTQPSQNDEIDLIDLFIVLWNGKMKIIGAVAISVLSVLFYQSYQPQQSFLATTNIKPINSSEALNYQSLNDIGFFKITSDGLLKLYIEKLDQRTIFEEGIRKYELLDRESFEDEQIFNEAVKKFAASIEILLTSADNWEIVYEYDDQLKWEQFLSYVNLSINQNVKKTIQQQFENSLTAARVKRDFEIQDIDTKIKNALSDYHRTTSDRLFYLKEQAAIARTLGLANNTIEAQTFGDQNNIVTNLQSKAPYYFRGYKSIEKEIQLMESRTNTKPFVAGLLALEQKQRALKQSMLLDRAEILFKNTPITSDGRFSAATMKILSTKFERANNKRILMLALAALVGGIISMFYVLILNSARNRKTK